jgi:hypothetical protein
MKTKNKKRKCHRRQRAIEIVLNLFSHKLKDMFSTLYLYFFRETKFYANLGKAAQNNSVSRRWKRAFSCQPYPLSMSYFILEKSKTHCLKEPQRRKERK